MLNKMIHMNFGVELAVYHGSNLSLLALICTLLTHSLSPVKLKLVLVVLNTQLHSDSVFFVVVVVVQNSLLA